MVRYHPRFDRTRSTVRIAPQRNIRSTYEFRDFWFFVANRVNQGQSAPKSVLRTCGIWTRIIVSYYRLVLSSRIVVSYYRLVLSSRVIVS